MNEPAIIVAAAPRREAIAWARMALVTLQRVDRMIDEAIERCELARASQRRHDTDRVKARYMRRERLHPYWNQRTAKAAGQYASHGCTCSCHMCGNPRKHFNRPTLAEVRADDVMREELQAIVRGDRQ